MVLTLLIIDEFSKFKKWQTVKNQENPLQKVLLALPTADLTKPKEKKSQLKTFIKISAIWSE